MKDVTHLLPRAPGTLPHQDGSVSGSIVPPPSPIVRNYGRNESFIENGKSLEQGHFNLFNVRYLWYFTFCKWNWTKWEKRNRENGYHNLITSSVNIFIPPSKSVVLYKLINAKSTRVSCQLRQWIKISVHTRGLTVNFSSEWAFLLLKRLLYAISTGASYFIGQDSKITHTKEVIHSRRATVASPELTAASQLFFFQWHLAKFIKLSVYLFVFHSAYHGPLSASGIHSLVLFNLFVCWPLRGAFFLCISTYSHILLGAFMYLYCCPRVCVNSCF